MVRVIDRISCLYQIADIVLGIEALMRNSGIESYFVTVGCVQVRLNTLKIRGRYFCISKCSLIVLNNKRQINQRPKLKLASIHTEVRLSAVVFTTF